METLRNLDKLKGEIYIISYLWNGERFDKEFVSRREAFNFYWKLRDEGKEPSMHFKGI